MKAVLMVVYFLIGLFFAFQTLGISTTKTFKDQNEGRNTGSLILVVALLELFIWPIMIIAAAGFVTGKKHKNEDESSDEEVGI